MVDKSIIGKKFEPFSYKVENNKIQELCLAIGDHNPIFHDREQAIAAGHEDTPIPLTFPTLFTFWGFPALWKHMQEVGIDTGKLLHMKEEYEYKKGIYPGTEVFGQMHVSDVRPGKMNIVTFETDYRNAKGEELLTARMTIVVKGE